MSNAQYAWDPRARFQVPYIRSFCSLYISLLFYLLSEVSLVENPLSTPGKGS